MSKKMNAFKNMCQEDQLALLKGGCTEMMILRSALNYDPDKDMWKIPHSQERMSNIKVDVLKEAKGNLYAEHAKFVRTFDPRWRDENIILILSAIALFTPDRPKVVHSDVIKLEQVSKCIFKSNRTANQTKQFYNILLFTYFPFTEFVLLPSETILGKRLSRL